MRVCEIFNSNKCQRRDFLYNMCLFYRIILQKCNRKIVVTGRVTMWKKAKYVLAAILLLYLAGFLPEIVDFINEKVALLSANIISLHPEIADEVSYVLDKIGSYSGHIIVIYAAIIALVIFLENSNPDRTLLWLAVLIFVPVFGLLLYLFIGPDLDNFRRRHNFKPKELVPVPERYKQDMRIQTAQMLHEVVGAELTVRNKAEMLINGEAFFEALLEAIAAAKTYIHFQYFIIRDDESGRTFRDALIDAAKRGVKVRVLYDAIGSRKITKTYVKSLRENGVQCLSFMPVSFPMFRRRMNFRNHRKICVIDGAVAFTGGHNISNDYVHKGRMGFWRDSSVRLEGQCVKELDKIFLEDWQDRTKETPQEVMAADNVSYTVNTSEKNPIGIQVVPSGVSSPWHSIEMGFVSVIARAKERLWLTTPYLVPGAVIMNVLRIAALSGVDVRIMIPEKGDSKLVYWASRSYLEDLLSAGVKLYLYQKGFVHAKTIVTDDDICSVGTCNMDIRSLEINFEDQIFIYNKPLTAEFVSQFEKDMQDSRELTLEEWQKRGLMSHLFESFGKLYSAQI